MRMPSGKTLAAMLVASLAGLAAGLLALHLLGEPTPLGGGR